MTVDLPHADRLALLQADAMGWIHSRTAGASLRSKGLAVYRGITAGDEQAHTLTDAGRRILTKVRAELDRDRVQLPTSLRPGVRFRTHLGDTVLTVDRFDPDHHPRSAHLWRIHTVEPWPIAGDPDRRWRDIDPAAPILIHTPDDWSLDRQETLW